LHRVSAEGEVWQINYNNQARDSFLSLPPEEVHDYYKALKKFDELLYHERNLVRLKLQPGNVGHVQCHMLYLWKAVMIQLLLEKHISGIIRVKQMI